MHLPNFHVFTVDFAALRWENRRRQTLNKFDKQIRSSDPFHLPDRVSALGLAGLLASACKPTIEAIATLERF